MRYSVPVRNVGQSRCRYRVRAIGYERILFRDGQNYQSTDRERTIGGSMLRPGKRDSLSRGICNFLRELESRSRSSMLESRMVFASMDGCSAGPASNRLDGGCWEHLTNLLAKNCSIVPGERQRWVGGIPSEKTKKFRATLFVEHKNILFFAAHQRDDVDFATHEIRSVPMPSVVAVCSTATSVQSALRN